MCKLKSLFVVLVLVGTTAMASSWLDAYLSMLRPNPSIHTHAVDLHHLIETESNRHGVPPAFSAAIAYVESNYNSCAISHKNAEGIMQLIPSTAASLNVADPYDPIQGVRGGIAYLGIALRQTQGDLALSAAYYNAGPKVLRTSWHKWPAETQNYIRKLARIWHKFEGNNWRREVPRTIKKTNRLVCSNV